jgi:hypothetical protein
VWAIDWVDEARRLNRIGDRDLDEGRGSLHLRRVRTAGEHRSGHGHNEESGHRLIGSPALDPTDRRAEAASSA